MGAHQEENYFANHWYIGGASQWPARSSAISRLKLATSIRSSSVPTALDEPPWADDACDDNGCEGGDVASDDGEPSATL